MSENWKMNDEDDVQMPLGVGGSDSGGELDFAETKKTQISSTAMLLIGVFVAGLALIYLLGLQNKPRAAQAGGAAEAQVNSAIEELLSKAGRQDELKKLFTDTDQLVQMFYHYPAAPSVEFRQLPGNLFEYETTKSSDPIVSVVTNGNAAEQERLRKLAESFAALKLQSIMVSRDGNLAMINNKLLKAGAHIGEFTIVDIEPQRVLLTHGTSKFELKLARAGSDE